MALRDQMLAGEPIIGIYGPLAGITRSAVVAAVHKIAANAPHAHLDRSYDPTSWQWRQHSKLLDPWCQSLVAPSIPATSDSVIECALTQYQDLSARTPLRFVVAGDYLIEVADHVLGDGRAFVDRFTAVARLAAGYEVDFGYFQASPVDRPVVRALRNLLWPPHREAAELFKTLLKPAAVTRRKQVAGSHAPWQPSPAVCYAYSPTPVQTALRTNIKSSSHPATMASAHAVILRRALMAADVPLYPWQTVVIDLRRYLPPGSGPVVGNFISGPIMSGDILDDPERLSHILQQWIHAGYPLAALVAGLARQRFARASPITTAPIFPRANLVFSSLTSDPELPPVSKNGDSPPGIYALCSPSTDPEKVNFMVTATSGALHITASFHDNVFDTDAIGRALELAAQDPVGLLASGSTRR